MFICLNKPNFSVYILICWGVVKKGMDFQYKYSVFRPKILIKSGYSTLLEWFCNQLRDYPKELQK